MNTDGGEGYREAEIEVAVEADLAVSASLSNSDSDLRCEDAIGLRH